jgi:hypothetical protein
MTSKFCRLTTGCSGRSAARPAAEPERYTAQSPMTDTVKVELEFAVDAPNSMTYAELYEGLDNIWYRFSADAAGNVELWANRHGFEYLGRYFLKLARTPKVEGYHAHSTLEFSGGPSTSEPELTIGILDQRLPAV